MEILLETFLWFFCCLQLRVLYLLMGKKISLAANNGIFTGSVEQLEGVQSAMFSRETVWHRSSPSLQCHSRQWGQNGGMRLSQWCTVPSASCCPVVTVRCPVVPCLVVHSGAHSLLLPDGAQCPVPSKDMQCLMVFSGACCLPGSAHCWWCPVPTDFQWPPEPNAHWCPPSAY